MLIWNGERGRIYAYNVFNHAFCDHLAHAGTQNLIDGFTRRQVDVLNYICAIYECRICYSEVAEYRSSSARKRTSRLPIAFAKLLVDITRTFFLCLSLSSWVRSALTTFLQINVWVIRKMDWIDIGGTHTRRPSDGSVPAIAPALAAVNDSTSSI